MIETGILTRTSVKRKSITLKSWQTAFPLKFVVSNYISGQHNTFAYKLEGYDKEWYYLTDSRTVSYSNLPQGTINPSSKLPNSDGKRNPILQHWRLSFRRSGVRPGGHYSSSSQPSQVHSLLFSASSGCAKVWKPSLK